MDRRNFLACLASGAAPLIFGGWAWPSATGPKKCDPKSIDVDWMRATQFWEDLHATAEIRWRPYGGEWRQQFFRLTPEQPVAWVTEEYGFGFGFFDTEPQEGMIAFVPDQGQLTIDGYRMT